jgi:hypothetical protein
MVGVGMELLANEPVGMRWTWCPDCLTVYDDYRKPVNPIPMVAKFFTEGVLVRRLQTLPFLPCQPTLDVTSVGLWTNQGEIDAVNSIAEFD